MWWSPYSSDRRLKYHCEQLEMWRSALILNMAGQNLQLEMETLEEGSNKQTSLLTVVSSEEFNSGFLLGMKMWLVQGKRNGY